MTRHAGFDLWGEAARGPGGAVSLLFGRIDNTREISGALGLKGAAQSQIYAAALARWQDDVDTQLIGQYCAITIPGPRRMRLVRSPWSAPPLHFAVQAGRIAASPLLSALFAAGVPSRIDWDHLVDQLAFDHRDCEPVGWYEGIGRVPLGTRVTIEDGTWSVARYYDPVDVPEVRFAHDEQYVEAANGLMDEAADAALAGLEAPAIMLSGGLDSPIAAAALLRRMPADRRLDSVTFAPHPDWNGAAPANRFADETDTVRAFAAMHPRLRPHFPDPRPGGHDHRLRDLLAFTHAPTANIANIGSFHACFETARQAGCDGVLTALHGNFTISLDADWAAAEQLARGRLVKAWKLASVLPDPHGHGPFRRLLASALLPLLPSRLQRAVRSRVHPDRFADIPLGSLISGTSARGWRERARARGTQSVFDEPPIAASRAAAIRAMWASADSGEDLDLGLARMHDVAHRDVTAYRPLIEFCHGLPTDQLRRDGMDRFLARRMARGIIPEAQRLDRRQGRHNADWYWRLGQRRHALMSDVEAIAAHPRLGRILDTSRMQDLLADWPADAPDAPAERYPREIGLTRALTAAAFVSHAERRNDF